MVEGPRRTLVEHARPVEGNRPVEAPRLPPPTFVEPLRDVSRSLRPLPDILARPPHELPVEDMTRTLLKANDAIERSHQMAQEQIVGDEVRMDPDTQKKWEEYATHLTETFRPISEHQQALSQHIDGLQQTKEYQDSNWWRTDSKSGWANAGKAIARFFGAGSHANNVDNLSESFHNLLQNMKAKQELVHSSSGDDPTSDRFEDFSNLFLRQPPAPREIDHSEPVTTTTISSKRELGQTLKGKMRDLQTSNTSFQKVSRDLIATTRQKAELLKSQAPSDKRRDQMTELDRQVGLLRERRQQLLLQTRRLTEEVNDLSEQLAAKK